MLVTGRRAVVREDRNLDERNVTVGQGSLDSVTSPSAGQADPHWLRALYEEHLGTVYRFIYSKVGNREEAEDLTSQVFLKAIRGVDETRTAQSLQAWLFQVARTTLADHWRAFYRLPSHSLDDLLAIGWDYPSPQAEEGAIDNAVAARAQFILDRLPARYREVLTCRFLLNYSLKETATRMNLSEANVKVLQFRALKKASQIEDNADERR